MSDRSFPELSPEETTLVGRADTDPVVNRIFWLCGRLEALFVDRGQGRGLYRDPRDGRFWDFSDLDEHNWQSECRLAAITPAEALRRYPVRHAAFHGLVRDLIQTGELRGAPALARVNAAAMLADLGKTDPPFALAALTGLSEDAEAHVRVQALDALYALDPAPSPTELERRIQILLTSRRADPKLADQVLRASGVPGLLVAVAAAPGLAKEERLWLLTSCAEQEPLTDEERAYLRQSLTDPDPEVRAQAAFLAARVGDTSGRVYPELLGRIRDDDPRVRRAALFAIGDLRLTDGSVVARLERLLEDPDPRMRADTAATFGKLGTAPASAAERLGRLLEDQEESVRVQAAYALSRMGPQARPARVWLERARKDGNRRVRDWAEAALREVRASGLPPAGLLPGGEGQ
jgi:HEAT repeat protein